MQTIELKNQLHYLLNTTDDFSLLTEVYQLLIKRVKPKGEVDFWDEIPDNIKQNVLESIEQANEGLLTPHSEVMSRLKAKYDLL